MSKPVTFKQNRVERWAIRQLKARGASDVRALQDVRHMMILARFAGVFGVTLLAPAMVLAFLAFSSIRSEEITLEADIRERAAAMQTQANQELGRIFRRFEDQASRRLLANAAATDNLGELSPYLRGAFRFDAQGLAAPFYPPGSPTGTEERAPHTRQAQVDAQLAEHLGDFEKAESIYTILMTSADRSLAGEAALGRARIRAKTEGIQAATEAYADVISDYGVVRDSRGFRIGDLAKLHLMELRAQDDPELAATAARDLVDGILASQWTIGLHGEPTVARRALKVTGTALDPDWTARTRTALAARENQLIWANRYSDQLLNFVGVRPARNGFNYQDQGATDVLWSAVVHEENLHVFLFDRKALITDLTAVLRRSTPADGDLRVRLIDNSTPASEGMIERQTLGPWLPSATVEISLTDPESLSNRKQQMRYTRYFVIGIALFLAIGGVMLSAVLVSREMEAARMKADFAANVSHELRSPITQIRLKGESLQFDLCTDDADRQAHYDAIVREAERLSRLVDNVLDFASIERGAKRYAFRPDDLLAVVWINVENARETIESQGIELQLTAPDDLPPIWLDREALGQVLTNLLSNAAKYGGSGGWIGVNVDLMEQSVAVSVKDRGIGISKEELPHVFDEFFRSMDPKVRKKKGTGIGLAIVRYIVEAHGGTITVDSARNEGTTFTVTLPIEPPEGVGAQS